jgi:RNA polymerase sigma-70 factor (ECF subfamily)
MTEHSQADDWLEGARGGDRLAIAKLLALHHPALAARVAERLDPLTRRRITPEDILQEVYLQVFRQVQRFEPRGPGSFHNWVLTIVDNKVLDAQRATRRARRDVRREVSPVAADRSASYLDLLEHVYRESGTPSRVVRRQEAVGLLLACVADLLESHRQVIELRFLQGLPVAEVARRLGKSEDAVVALTQRALQALRAAMNRLGDVTHGG